MSECQHLSTMTDSITEIVTCLQCGASGPQGDYTGEVYWNEAWTHTPAQGEIVKLRAALAAEREARVRAEQELDELRAHVAELETEEHERLYGVPRKPAPPEGE